MQNIGKMGCKDTHKKHTHRRLDRKKKNCEKSDTIEPKKCPDEWKKSGDGSKDMQ